MKLLLTKSVAIFGEILIQIGSFSSIYMCWAFLDEVELPKELQHSDFE